MKKAADDAQERSRRAAEEALDLARKGRAAAGILVHRGVFEGTTVEIYDGGYVRVGLFISEKTPYERLRSIKHSFQVQDKSAGGRAAMGLMTGGLNYLASKEKRIIFLTIATDARVHTLKATGGMTRIADNAALAIEAAGLGVLDTLARGPVAATATAAPPPAQDVILGQIETLGRLYAAGMLTDEEFASKKTDLPNRL